MSSMVWTKSTTKKTCCHDDEGTHRDIFETGVGPSRTSRCCTTRVYMSDMLSWYTVKIALGLGMIAT
jgi:hypothetical protein